VAPSSVQDSAPVKSEDELEQELAGIDWLSIYSPLAEKELYDRYKSKLILASHSFEKRDLQKLLSA